MNIRKIAIAGTGYVENEALVEAFMKSNKNLEEAVAFFESDPIETNEDETKPRGRRGRKKRASE